MTVTRWKMMILALFVLLVNSSLAHAENRIISMTPARIQPGKVVTLHGQFTVAKFRSRQYRIILNKKIAPRPQGAINGFVDTFRVTPTSVMLRIPRSWRGKPVYPGEYFLSIKDMSRNRIVFSGFSLNPLFISRGNRTALGTAKNLMLGGIKAAQPKGLGNIGQTSRPAIGGVGRNAPQMKLMFRGLKMNNQNVLSGVSMGDSVTARFDIQNLGATAGQVKIGYMIGGRPQFSSNGFVNVAPGQKASLLINVRINSADRNIHLIRGVEGAYWSPVFRLLTTGNNPYRDSYMADNMVRGGSLANIPVKPRMDLAVVSIEGIRLKESWQGGGQWDDGTTHPLSMDVIIKVRNNSSQTSRPTRLEVSVLGKQSAHSAAERDPGIVRHQIGRCAYWPICTLKQNVSIGAIAAGQTGVFRVRFNNIPHQIVQSKRHHVRVALGPFICARPQVGVIPGRASVTAFLRQANADEAPLFRANNRLTLTGKFGRGDTCGMENTRMTRR